MYESLYIEKGKEHVSGYILLFVQFFTALALLKSMKLRMATGTN
jgi:hypothetical protein